MFKGVGQDGSQRSMGRRARWSLGEEFRTKLENSIVCFKEARGGVGTGLTLKVDRLEIGSCGKRAR